MEKLFGYQETTLDKLKQNGQRLAIKTCNKNFDQPKEPAILLLDGIIQKWTQNQAELVYYKLQNKKEDEIAKLARNKSVSGQSKNKNSPMVCN